jgi:Sugar (and other) transporter
MGMKCLLFLFRADYRAGLTPLPGEHATTTPGPSMVAGAGILGVELSPTRVRTIGQSVTVVGGRIGASISAFLFPPLFGVLGETGVIAMLAAVSGLGAIATLLVIPETAQRSLEEINADAESDLATVAAE